MPPEDVTDVEKTLEKRCAMAYIGAVKTELRAEEAGKDAGVKAVLYLPEGSCVEPTGEEDRIIGRLWELLEP